MRWRLVLEELNAELIYMKGSSYIVADALCRLDKIDNLNSNDNYKIIITIFRNSK